MTRGWQRPETEWEDMACAAIEAMREPTDEMREILYGAGPLVDPGEFTSLWIDAALGKEQDQ